MNIYKDKVRPRPQGFGEEKRDGASERNGGFSALQEDLKMGTVVEDWSFLNLLFADAPMIPSRTERHGFRIE